MSAQDILMAAAGASGDSKTYIEDVFSTYLYTGNGSTQTINNGIDLAGKGGMVWIKHRNLDSAHALYDTSRGVRKALSSIWSSSQYSAPVGNELTAFNSNGFTVGTDYNFNVNSAGYTFSSWTFRKAPKFFDVVTYTGNGVDGRAINHSLGQAPGMIIVKCTSTTGDWQVWHRANTSIPGVQNMKLNSTAATATLDGRYWYGSLPSFQTDTQFFVGTDAAVNASGATYVAYLFAHDTTADGLIQCGSFTTTGGDVEVNLGWEPQYILARASSTVDDWYVYDTMRGMSNTQTSYLRPNNSTAENSFTTPYGPVPTATGFVAKNSLGWGVGTTIIYMAIRRGPMRTPTDGTKVFQPITRTGTGSATIVNTTITTDLSIIKNRSSGATNTFFTDRLRDNYYISSQSTNMESANTLLYPAQMWDNQSGFDVGSNVSVNASTSTYINYAFQRAPGFFDVVCYTGTVQSPTTVSHNLKVAPELIIIKNRYYGDAWSDWFVYAAPLGADKLLYLNKTNAAVTDNTAWFNTIPTATQFKVDNYTSLIHEKAVAYLFASCPGVSKVGTYTGNGSSQTINCGFANGARFVLIKRTNSTGDWYVWDTARGIVAATDPHLSLNTTAAEVTTDDTIDPNSTGFIVNQVTATNVNVNAATYIYLAIA